MNFLLLSIGLILAGAASLAVAGVDVVTKNASLLLSFEAIILAAVLVRLNRGVPSLDWKSVDPATTERLLSRLEEVAKIYISVVVVAITSVVLLLWMQFSTAYYFPHKVVIGQLAVAIFGAFLGLLLSRMAYVVWLDLDIVRLQKAVIMSAARSDEQKRQDKLAQEKLAKMESAKLK